VQHVARWRISTTPPGADQPQRYGTFEGHCTVQGVRAMAVYIGTRPKEAIASSAEAEAEAESAEAEPEVSDETWSRSFMAGRDAAVLLQRHAECAEEQEELIDFAKETISEHVISGDVLSCEEVETLLADIGVQIDPDEASELHQRIADMTRPDHYALLEAMAAAEEGGGDEDDGTCEMCERETRRTWHHLVPKKVHNRILKRGSLPLNLQTVSGAECTRIWLNAHGIKCCRPCHNVIHEHESEESLAEVPVLNVRHVQPNAAQRSPTHRPYQRWYGRWYHSWYRSTPVPHIHNRNAYANPCFQPLFSTPVFRTTTPSSWFYRTLRFISSSRGTASRCPGARLPRAKAAVEVAGGSEGWRGAYR